MNQEAEILDALLDGDAAPRPGGADAALLRLAGELERAIASWRLAPEMRPRLLARVRDLAGAGSRRRRLRLPAPGRLSAVVGGTALVAAAAAIGVTVAHQRRSGAAA